MTLKAGMRYGARQHAHGHVRDPGAVGAHIGARVVGKGIFHRQYNAAPIHRRADMVVLLARRVGA